MRERKIKSEKCRRVPGWSHQRPRKTVRSRFPTHVQWLGRSLGGEKQDPRGTRRDWMARAQP